MPTASLRSSPAPTARRETIHGAYIVSGEGARSIIRKDLDIEFEGFTYSDRTLNIEVAYDFRQHGYTERNYISDPDEWSNLFHWTGPPDRWRVHFPTAPEDETASTARPEALQARLQRFLPTGKEFEIVGSNLYTVHQRVAQKFRVGRAILAGDSAHVNSPIGAMGMNSGIHDAFNLADKLIAILRGEAGEDVLDRYERQRRHVAVQHTPGADHPQQAAAGGEGPGGAPEEPRRAAPHGRRPEARARFPAALVADRQPPRGREDPVNGGPCAGARRAICDFVGTVSALLDDTFRVPE